MTEVHNPPTTAAAVANAFLDIQKQDQDQFPRIDQMKLYKLVYYAHAWWLAQKNEPLFEDDIHAWPWGPVVPKLYAYFKSAGSGDITTQRALDLISTGDRPYDVAYSEPKKPNDEVMDYLKQVWETHKVFTGVALSNATHAEGEPWEIIKRTHGSLENKPHIPNPLIEKVFKVKIADAA